MITRERRQQLFAYAAWRDTALDHYGSEKAVEAMRNANRIIDSLGPLSDEDYRVIDAARAQLEREHEESLSLR